MQIPLAVSGDVLRGHTLIKSLTFILCTIDMHVNEYVTKMCSALNYADEFKATRDYLFSHCYNPQKIKSFNSYTGTFEEIEVGCGRCFHCLNKKREEWVTRMYAHAEDFKNVYFVTLTYRSVKRLTPVTRYFMTYLNEALWHYDNKNSNNTYSYNPCVICQKHFQDFLKRLRKYSGLRDLTYMVSYEYGHQYGRPHAHFVFFSNGVLKKSDVQKAWSMLLYTDDQGNVTRARNHRKQNVHRLSFGMVDFNDLVKNGTFDDFNQNILVDGKQMNARNCFTYVCKYMTKRDYNYSRVHLAFSAFERGLLPVYYDSLEVLEFDSFNDYKEKSLEYNKSHDIPCIVGVSDYLFTNKLKIQKFYEKAFAVLLDNLKLPISKDVSDDWSSFCEYYRPFNSVSRGTPIGSIYAKRNIENFVQGKFDRPILQKSGVVIPRYFVRKAQEYVFGFRQFSRASKTPSFVKGNLLASVLDLHSLATDTPVISLCCVHANPETNYSFFNSQYANKDLNTGERYFFLREVVKGHSKISVLYYRYNRGSRRYSLTRTQSLYQFMADYIVRFETSLADYKKKSQQIKMELEARDKCIKEYKGDFGKLLYECYRDIEQTVSNLDELYQMEHKSLE